MGLTRAALRGQHVNVFHVNDRDKVIESARLGLAGRWLYIQLVPLRQGTPQ